MPKKTTPKAPKNILVEGTPKAESFLEQNAPTPPESPAESLVPVKATKDFTDGSLMEALAKYGYRPEWPAGEVRKLPIALIQRCAASGGSFELIPPE